MWPIAAGEAPEYLQGIAVLVVTGAAVAYFGLRIGLVPIVAFLLTGVIVGPNALGVVDDLDTVQAAAEVGVLLLLFTIGLEFNLGRLREVRRSLVIGGGVQVGTTTAITTLVLVAAGVDASAAVFTGLLVALSSTAIVLKLLGDRGEISAPHGRTAVAVLLFQDLAIVGMVLVVPMLGGDGGGALDITWALVRAGLLIALVLVVARRLLPPMLERVARTCSPEIFLLTVVAICFGTAYGVSLAGVSVSLGAFLAGLLVAESRFDAQAMGEVLPLQIIFSATFFVSVGMLLDVGFVFDNLPVVVGAIAAVFAVKVLATGLAVLALGERIGLAAAVGLMLAQVGEFSFVLAEVGAEADLTPAGLGEDGRQTFIAATVLMMAATPMLMGLSRRLALSTGTTTTPAAPDLVGVPGDTAPAHGSSPADGSRDHVVVAGYGRWARGLAHVLGDAGIDVVVVTLSPDGAHDAAAGGIPVLLGDPVRERTLREAGLDRARALVVPDDEAERAGRVVRVARTINAGVHVVVRTRYAHDIDEILASGADEVVSEDVEASVAMTMRLLRGLGHDDEAALARARQLRVFHLDGDAPPRLTGRPAQHGSVDTEALIDVVLPADACPHAGQVRPVVARSSGCEECLRDGDAWVHLRVCLTCGHVGCCDSSPNRHARAHHETTGHHVMRSAEPGESWVWCFEDERELAPRTE